MRPLRAAMFVGTLGCFLTWGYCIVRIFTGDFPFSDEFIQGIPVTFLHLSILSFVLAHTFLWAYLVITEVDRGP